MDSQIIDAVTEWDSVSVDGGYEGLHRLADRDFSGAVSTETTWAFVLNGRVIGVFDGDIEDFEDADLTAYRAPDMSLPILFAMMETGGETRAKYYTNETPLADADSTLSSGGFTGYVELSENVLSGDYYIVYHGGKSMSAAFVGSSRRLVTGDEAFEKANDEVGIYEVKDVDVEIVELPEIEAESDDSQSEPDEVPSPSESSEGGEAPVEEPPSDVVPDAEVESDDVAEGTSAARQMESDDAGDPSPEASPDAVEPDTTSATPGATETAETTDATAAEAEGARATETPDATADADTTVDADATADTNAAGESAGRTTPSDDAERRRRAAERAKRRSESADEGDGDDGASDKDPFSAEEKWREARSIPSLDPSESSTNNGSGAAAKTRARPKGKSKQAAQKRRRSEKQSVSRSRSSSSSSGASSKPAEDATKQSSSTKSAEGTGDASSVQKLKQRLEKLQAHREKLESERDELRAERDEQHERAETLEARVEELEAEVERLTDRLEAASGGFVAEESMPPTEALSGTNLFVRYNRKGEATLERAHRGEVSREEVNDNLRLEHHTTFDTEGLGVDGEPYEQFLHESTEYGFAKWVVTDLLYEIGETGNRTALSQLFDAIPKIDRVELHGTVGVDTEDGVEQREFDVIFRDQMGDALFVADMNTSRNATTQAMVGSLIENARTIAEGDEGFSTAFYVTESFFDPEALEAVSEETGGGFLSRSKHKSFVKLSRKQGFHLCLVEARNNEFHVNVPDL